jgi:Zn-dependent protease with chaperone function
MQAVGFETHAAQNRKRAVWFVLSYLLIFQLLAASIFAVVMIASDFDALLTFDIIGYFATYSMVFVAISLFFFGLCWRQQKRMLKTRLKIKEVSKRAERRFAAIVEQQATLQGIRSYRLGIVESDARNALTLPGLLSEPLIVATRGLLDSLNDDEVAAVVAHELAHIRGQDGLILFVNVALMRTATTMQIENLLRPEGWDFLFVAFLFPFALPLYLLGGLSNMLALKLAWRARAEIAVGRDHIADGEAIRMTHFPEALIGAIRKCGGHGCFPNADAAEPFLFEGKPQGSGGTHAGNDRRIEAIERFAHELRMKGRTMRDTRTGPMQPAVFGRKGGPAAVAQGWQNWDRAEKPKRPAPYDWSKIMLRFSDPEAFDKWDMQRVAYFGWRPDDNRNIFGLKRNLVLPIAVGIAAIAVFHYPTNAPPGQFASAYLQGRIMSKMSNAESLKCALQLAKPEQCPNSRWAKAKAA